MKHTEDTYLSADGLNLYYQVWRPDETPKAVIQLMHGYASYSGRLINVVNELIPRGYVIYAADHRGHGKSEGLELYVKKFAKFIEDQKIFFDLIREKEPNLPHFILGHSMGSTIAEQFVATHPELEAIKGLILSGVGIKIGTIHGFKKALANFLALLASKKRVTVDEAEKLSHDPEVVEAYRKDPMVSKKPTVKIGVEFANACSKANKLIGQIKIPTLVQFGSEDIVMLEGEKFVKKLIMPDKTIKKYDELYHEVYNESAKDRKIVLKDLGDWLDNHL